MLLLKGSSDVDLTELREVSGVGECTNAFVVWSARLARIETAASRRRELIFIVMVVCFVFVCVGACFGKATRDVASMSGLGSGERGQHSSLPSLLSSQPSYPCGWTTSIPNDHSRE